MTAKPSLPTRTPSAVPVAVPTSTPQTRGSALATASPTATDSASPAAPTPGDAATVSGSARATASTTPTGSFAFSATLAEANLPTAATAYWASPSDLAPAGDWTGSWGDAEQFSACGGNYTSLGYRTIVRRDFSGAVSSASVNAHTATMEFTTAAKASEARATIRKWYYNCPTTLKAAGYTNIKAGTAQDISAGQAVAALDPHQASFRTLMKTNPGPDITSFEDATLVQAGNRLQWVAYEISGVEDHNYAVSTSDGTGLPLYPAISRAPLLAADLVK